MCVCVTVSRVSEIISTEKADGEMIYKKQKGIKQKEEKSEVWEGK